MLKPGDLRCQAVTSNAKKSRGPYISYSDTTLEKLIKVKTEKNGVDCRGSSVGRHEATHGAEEMEAIR